MFHSILAPTSLIQTVERQIATDWTIPLLFSYQGVFIKNPTSVYNYIAYIEPMTNLSWMLTIFFLFFMPIWLSLISDQSKDDEKFDIKSSFGATYAALLLLGSRNEPISISSRIIFVR